LIGGPVPIDRQITKEQMDAHKIASFRKANANTPFPEYVPLTEHEAGEVDRMVRRRLAVPTTMTPADLLMQIRARSTRLHGASAFSSNFDLAAVAAGLSPPAPAHVVINWYRFDEMDRMALRDLAAHLKDIWYPSVDDIEIIDPAGRWIISVDHEGRVYVLDLL
jgi:hypothetical protein